MTPQQYFDELVKAVGKHTTELFPSVVLAQAILESGLFTASGPSGLAVKYNNFFGIKSSKSWSGKTTPGLDTLEDDGSGRKYNIKAGFRWYDSIEDSVKDHNALFQTDFSKSFYKDVLSAKTPSEQTQALQGTYATDTKYASKLNAIIKQYNLTQYDKKQEVKGEMATAQQVLNVFQSWVGKKESDGSFKSIIDLYNSIPASQKAIAYTLKYSDEWCDGTVSAAFYKAGALNLIGKAEVGVQRHIEIFKNIGIWIGKTKKPVAGDIVCFDWDGGGFSDHIGIVKSVSGNNITTIEGNTNSRVGSNTFVWNDWRISGYARPKYSTSTTSNKLTFEQAVQAVISGSMGNGDTRVANIKKAGQDPQKVQAEVNKRLTTPTKPTKSKEQVVKDVIAGKYGAGQERRDKLTKDGFNADEIQKLVNEALKPTVDFSGHKNIIELSKDLIILDKVGGTRRGMAIKGTKIKFDEVYINDGLYIAYLNGKGERCYIEIAEMRGNKVLSIQGTVSKL